MNPSATEADAGAEPETLGEPCTVDAGKAERAGDGSTACGCSVVVVGKLGGVQICKGRR